MHADSFATPISGLPTPSATAVLRGRAAAAPLVAWFIDVAIILLIGVPRLAVLVRLVTLGFGFAVFGLIVAKVGLFYRT